MTDYRKRLEEAIHCAGGFAVDNGPVVVRIDDLRQLLSEGERMREALVRLRDCDWVITPLDRMDAVRDIARQALGDPSQPDGGKP